ncbi:C40 family peptidase [Subtercola endophyticus]|uniref:C40 family peptidase n=1 Tax=Subtercola endophyticus TaxID=2895559 RepID=UPI001E3E7193|nr:NlpC/P60 family protein [Subtercola endophyticus]UFS59613.1 C40 family peptidase [Subtercola endophyticus]
MPFSSETPDSPESQPNPKTPDSATTPVHPTRRSLREAQDRSEAQAPSTAAVATNAAIETGPAAIAASVAAESASVAVTSSAVELKKAAPVAVAPTAVASAAKPLTAAKRVATVPPVATKPRFKRPTKRGIISTVVMTAAAALVATMAIPAYAFSTNGAFDPSTSTQSILTGQQTLEVDASAANATVGRDNYQAPTKDELAAQQQAAAAAAAAAAAQAAALKVTAVVSAASSGASAAVVDNAPVQPYDGNAVVAYAKQFVGVVPYGNGNSPDTSFSCDGLVQYVMKHFGINLPRTVSNQAAMGVRIPASEAQPGDVMIYPIGHTEIYAGNGMAVTAPDWGRMVEFDPVWGSYYFVRYYPNS